MVHLVPGLGQLRSRLIDRLGKNTYLAGYALLSLLGIVLVVYGKSRAEFQPVWFPPDWSREFVIGVMAVAFYLFAAGDMKSNLKRYTNHPMLWGIVLWSAAHLLANGDLASILLFSSFLVFSLFAMFSINKRGSAKQKESYGFKRDVLVVIAGLLAYGVFMVFLHPWLIGVAIV